MGRTLLGDIKAKRTGMGDRTLEFGRVIHGTIKQKLKITNRGNVRFEMVRTQQNFIERRFGRSVAGFNKKLNRTGLVNGKQLERIFPNNLTIRFGRVVADYSKIEFGRTAMGNLSFETARLLGGDCKIKLSRQVSGDSNYYMGRTTHGDGKHSGRVVPGFVRECGRVTPNTIQFGRVLGGTVQYSHAAPSF